MANEKKVNLDKIDKVKYKYYDIENYERETKTIIEHQEEIKKFLIFITEYKNIPPEFINLKFSFGGNGIYSYSNNKELIINFLKDLLYHFDEEINRIKNGINILAKEIAETNFYEE